MKSYFLTSEQCSRVSLNDPGIGRSSRNLWIKEQLGILYPGSTDRLIWDFRSSRNELILYYMGHEQLEEIRKITGKCHFYYEGEKYEIFRSSRWAPKVLRALAVTAAAALLLAIMIIVPLLQRSVLEERISALDKKIESQEVLSAENIERKELFSEISYKLSLMEQSAPPDLYDRISRLTPYFNGEFKILSLTISEDSLQGRAMGDDPLMLIEDIRSDARFSDIEIENTDVDSLQGYEVFSWKGNFDE